jgi:hypothetical protein
MPCTLSEPTEFQLTIQYPLCITLSVETTVDLLLTEFQPTINALHSICRDDSRPSAALLRCTETNKFQLTIHCDLFCLCQPSAALYSF